MDASSIPNRFDHAEAQRRLYAFWEERGCFDAEPEEDKPPFCIVIPPPNVTGALHLGHALNNTLQDTLIRMKRMQGYSALWMPGTDHAGIATQAIVEKRLKEDEGLTRHDLGREKLVERIWAWKDQYEKRIIGQLKRMGCSCDWRRTRFTLDERCARAVRATFFDLFNKDYIYRGRRLVNWDTFLQTAVSDDEVFHETVKGHFWHFRYPVIDPQPGEPTHVTIATTRPETMLGDTAVAVHPNPAAALDEAQRELEQRLAEAPPKEKPPLAAQLEEIARRKSELLPQLVKLREMALAGRKLMLPLQEREIPLVADAWAKPELGSGCVKITPAHDPNDYEVGLRCGLPMVNILERDGKLGAEAGAYRGLSIQQARKKVVADLEALGLLENVEDREIDLAHSDRSKTPIEPLLADQWFVKMDVLAQSAIDAVADERVKIFPQRYRKGYIDWLAEKRDWPIGRQLWWGHQIPVWTIRGSREQLRQLPHVASIQLNGGQAQIALKPDLYEILSATATCDATTEEILLFTCVAPGNEEWEQKLESAGMIREDEVLDTWFSSALWPHSTLGWPEDTDELAYYYPTSTLITSRDIITLWVARMVLMGLNNVGEVPFDEVFIHPKILDGYGETMSKSKGNGVDPLDVVEKFGADALRFGLAYLTTETQDVRMSVQFECPHCSAAIDQTRENREKPKVVCSKCGKEFATQWAKSEADLALPRGAVLSDRFELARNFCNKLWNASRFALMNLDDYKIGPVHDADLAPEDRWILSRLTTVTNETTAALERYGYHDAAQTLYDFAWNEFCSVYVEMLKNRFQNPAAKATAQRVLAHCLDVLLRLLHPIAPFITEEIWQLLNRAAPQRGLANVSIPSETIMLADWPQAEAARISEAAEGRFRLFRDVLGAVNEIRSRQNIPPKAKVEFAVRCTDEAAALLNDLKSYFESMANATATAIGPTIEPPPSSAQVSVDGADVFVDLSGHIDPAAERARLGKQIEKLGSLIQSKEKKLSNESFTARAPADVVLKERESLAQMKEQLAVAEAALSALL